MLVTKVVKPRFYSRICVLIDDLIANIFLRCYKFYVVRVSYINSSGIEASSILSISCLKV